MGGTVVEWGEELEEAVAVVDGHTHFLSFTFNPASSSA